MKTASKTASASNEGMRAIARGGALLRGGSPGNRGNPNALGVPPSLIRSQLRGSYDQRRVFLNDVVDGVVMVQTEVPLSAIIPHVICSACSGPVAAKDTVDAFFLMVPAKQTASVKDRIAALDQMARYGLGTLKEVSVENVRERVAATLGVIRAQCSPEQAESIVNALRPVWV